MEFNLFDNDDSVFPTTAAGRVKHEGQVLEAAGEGSPDAVDDLAEKQLRSMAMGAVLTWIEEGEYTYMALDQLVIGVADLDGDEDLTDEESAVYEDLWPYVADAMLTMGADEDNVREAIGDEDDDACEKLGGFLSAVMDEIKTPDDEIVSAFAAGEEGAVFEAVGPMKDCKADSMVLEAVYKKMKVVRNGKLVIKKKRVSGKVRLSAAQKSGLKKARRKANTSAAKLKRRKGMRIRKQRGL